MTPPPADSSPLEVLRQLKALLDQGAITAAEYDTLKQRLLAGPGPVQPPAAITFSAADTTPPPLVLPAPAPVSAPPAGGELPSLLDMFRQAPAGSSPASASAPDGPPAPEPVAIAPPAAFSAGPPAPEVSFLPAAAPAAPVVPHFRPAPAPYQPAAPAARFEAPAAASDFTPQSVTQPDTEPDTEPARPAGRALPTVLLVLGGLALLLVLSYLFLGSDRDDERLTSRSRTAADSVAVRPEVGPQDEPLNLPPAAAAEPAVTRVETAEPATFPTQPDSAATGGQAATRPAPAGRTVEEPVFPGSSAPSQPAVAPAPVPMPASPAPSAPAPAPAASAEPAPPAGPATAPEDGDDEATTSVRGALSRFYTDLQAAPFNASQHFAPTVERLYTRQNLTPAAIEEDLNRSMFPEFRQRVTRVVPGTLRVGPPAADGTRTATYTEQSRAFRVSRNQFQRTRTQVRVRFNPAYKMTYMRQEKLLENTFE